MAAGPTTMTARDVPREPAFALLADAAGRFAAFALLAGLAPLLAACALVVFLLSRRPPWIAHQRVGRYGEPFAVWKLRTMWPPGAREWRAGWVEMLPPGDEPDAVKPACDPRVSSSFARFCRRYSIDELPQLANVVAGQMALVGPRPLIAAELRRHYRGLEDEIVSVKPWHHRVCGRWRDAAASATPSGGSWTCGWWRERSLRLHLAILARTIPAVLAGRDAW